MAGTARHRSGSASPDRLPGDVCRHALGRGPSRPRRVRRLHVTPLPAPFGGGGLVQWRLDQAKFSASWDSGEGGRKFGGRWHSVGVAAVYCSVDPSNAILEVAVHKGFRALDTEPHVLTSATMDDFSSVHVVMPESLPNPNWARPGTPGDGQRAYGDALLARHKFVLFPNAVSVHSWNAIFVASVAAGAYSVRAQERFALDTRLHPPTTLLSGSTRRANETPRASRLRSRVGFDVETVHGSLFASGPSSIISYRPGPGFGRHSCRADRM